ncbi:MAG: tyrosine-type recombinase/integrase [Candidatus Hydrogenedentes bacterium]|nr:tyrosine-type recombinase/integrase [Candidatus Hydrogenedentota bacterium]
MPKQYNNPPRLRQDSEGFYIIDYLDDTGTRKRPRLKFTHAGRKYPTKDPSVAQRLFDAMVQTIVPPEAPTRQAGPDPRIRETNDHYLYTYLPTASAAPRTHGAYLNHLSTWQSWCNANNIGRWSQVNRETIQRYALHLQKTHTQQTTNNFISAIRATVNEAIVAGILTTNPVTKWPLGRVDDKEIQAYSPAQIKTYLDTLHPKYNLWCIARFIAYTGNRPSDAISLTYSQVIWETQHIDRVSVKVRALRKYKISTRALNAITDAIGARKMRPADPIFLRDNGTPWSKNSLYNAFTRALTAAGHDGVNFKAFRSSFATAMANPPIRCTLPTLQVLMGHTDIATTMRYVRAEGGVDYIEQYADLLDH